MAIQLWKGALVLLLSLVLNANAGHPVWETISRVDRPEWLAIEHYPQGIRLWPDKKIRYAFADEQSRVALEGITRSAHNLWLNSGLPDDFTMEQISLRECEEGRETCLKIRRGGAGLSTPVGTSRKPSPGDRGFQEAYWTESREAALFEPVSNIAHEIGHAWGLIHEMQNRLFYFDEDREYNPFLVFDYRCENVWNYHQVIEDFDLDPGQVYNREDGICYDATFADFYGFAGKAWQPYMGYMLQYSKHKTFTTFEEVDWDSIMMYPSYMGAVGGGQDDHDFDKAVILKAEHAWPGDRWMNRNLHPSQQDIEGLKILYGHKWPIPAPTLLGDFDSPYRSAFRQLAPGCHAS